jgi:hypothetical protein
MSGLIDAEEKEGYPCNTCHAMFSSVEKVKTHYKGDWHVFNSKRRAHELVPLSKADFKAIEHTLKKPASKKKVAVPSAASPSKRTSANQPQQPASGSAPTSPEGKATARTGAGAEADSAVPLTWGGITANTADEMVQIAKGMGIGEDRLDSIVELAVSRRDADIKAEAEYRAKKRAAFLKANPDAAAAEDAEAEAVAVAAAARAGRKASGDGEGEGEDDDDDSSSIADEDIPEIGPNACIFDNKVFESTAENVKYMRDTYGFFVPDQDILEDLDGLVGYLNEKVKLGGFCLYCQKHFMPGKPCQQHMLSKSHCKVAYAEDIDLDEFEDFYDYDKANEGLEVDEDGNYVSAQATIDPVTGELRLPNGRTVGHRMYRTYYKQYHAPEDTRPSVIAAKREELLKLGISVGHDYTEENIVAMPDSQVMNLVVKYHKAKRRELALQQRAQQKDLMRAKRTDHTIKQSKQRSSEQRTQIIRDYHGGLQ